MAKTLSTVALADLLPSSIAADKTVSAAAGAIDPELRLSSANAALLPILSRIDDLPESWLDRLAWQWHADLYEQDLTIEQKRMIVKRVLLVHRFKGTPYAVKQALADMERDVTLIEYTGEHHIFELAVDLTGGEDIADLTERIFRRVNSAKPASRHLRGVRHVLSAAKTAVFGAAFSNDAKIEIWPAKPSTSELPDLHVFTAAAFTLESFVQLHTGAIQAASATPNEASAAGVSMVVEVWPGG